MVELFTSLMKGSFVPLLISLRIGSVVRFDQKGIWFAGILAGKTDELIYKFRAYLGFAEKHKINL